MAKTRKCPDCSSKMSVRKSSKGENNRFWGCTDYPNCKKTIPYFGDGAMAGCDLDIHQISNGFILRVTAKYSESDDELPTEVFCKADNLSLILTEVCAVQVKKMLEQIENQAPVGFDKEESTPKEPRLAKVNTTTSVDATASDQSATGGKDIKSLLIKARGKPLTES